MDRKNIFSFSVSTGSYLNFVCEIINLSENYFSSYVCFANVHMAVEAYHNPTFNKVINNANIVTPDGKPLSMFLRLFQGIRQERICGMDIISDILKEAAFRNKSVYFYGSTDEVLKKIISKAKTDFPTLTICGAFSPPFRSLSPLEKEHVVKTINEADPDLIFVSLGCPKQEIWMAEHQGRVRGCMLGLGQAFKTYAGFDSRSPVWMRRYALEWLYRLYLEPARLAKRYLITNSQFLYLTLKYFIKNKVGR